ncbi:hypothetical protein ES703_83203 [subsurface metagenome]
MDFPDNASFVITESDLSRGDCLGNRFLAPSPSITLRFDYLAGGGLDVKDEIWSVERVSHIPRTPPSLRIVVRV